MDKPIETNDTTAAEKAPTVALIGGMDPSGGAGLAADCQVVRDFGWHAAPITTAVTAQNTRSGMGVFPVTAEQLRAQLDAVFSDLNVVAIKIGLLPTAELMQTLEQFLHQCLDLPVVLDPVLSSSTGLTLNADAAALAQLFPHTTLLTPNRAELAALTGTDAVEPGLAALFAQRATTVLVKGADHAAAHSSQAITNTLANAELSHDFVSLRLPGTYRGTGCRLATAIAILLANGADVGEAVLQAEEYLQESLQRGTTIGHGSMVPG